MTTPMGSQRAEGERGRLDPPSTDMIRLWQHFVSTAGDDKNKMITIATWLLGISAAVLGYLAKDTVDAETKQVLSAVGIGVSVLGLYIVWLYSAHETWNRRKAETLAAKDPTLSSLLPAGDRPKGGPWVFGFFLALTSLSLIVQIILAA